MKNPIVPKRSSGRPLQGYNPSLRVVSTAENKGGPVCLGRSTSGGPDGNTIQQPSKKLFQPDRSHKSRGNRRQMDELEQMDIRLPVPSPCNDRVGFRKDLRIQRESTPDHMPVTIIPPVVHLRSLTFQTQETLEPTNKGWMEDRGAGSWAWEARIFLEAS